MLPKSSSVTRPQPNSHADADATATHRSTAHHHNPGPPPTAGEVADERRPPRLTDLDDGRFHAANGRIERPQNVNNALSRGCIAASALSHQQPTDGGRPCTARGFQSGQESSSGSLSVVVAGLIGVAQAAGDGSVETALPSVIAEAPQPIDADPPSRTVVEVAARSGTVVEAAVSADRALAVVNASNPPGGCARSPRLSSTGWSSSATRLPRRQNPSSDM